MEISTPISWLSALEMEDLMLFQEPYDDIHQSLDEIMSHNNMDHEFMPLNMNQTQHQHQHQRHPPLSTSAVINANDVTKQPTTTTTAATTTAMTNTKCSKPTRKHPKVQSLTSPTPNTCFPVILNFGSSILSKEDENDNEEEHVSSLVIDEEVEFPREDVLYGNIDDVIDEEPPAKRKYSKRSSTTCTKKHIMSERRRREKLSQRFAALSALVPHLKRMEKEFDARLQDVLQDLSKA